MAKPLLLLFSIAVTVSPLIGQSPDTPAYTWAKTGPLQVARQGACAAALPDGRILVAGGQDASGPLRSVEIYQQDGTFASARELQQARTGHTCTSLSDGRILVAGGLGTGEPAPAETYDPVTNTWVAAENGSERWNHTATLLPDGRVLLAGGETADGPTSLLEWFNPATNRIRPLPANLLDARTLHASALLPDGSVLISGGWNAQSLLDSTEIVKLDGSLVSAPALPAARAGHTATALDTGCILIAGGLGVDGNLKSATLYCADTGTYRPTGDMSVARYGHLALLLPNNARVLVTSGFSQGEATDATELYDADANAFVSAGSLTLARLGIAAAADPTTGAVLAVGGYTADGPVAACGILRVPSLTFDKPRYVEGDAITVSGLGWANSETINFSVSITSFANRGQTAQTTTQTLQTKTSALGRIQATLSTAVAVNAGATFRVTAMGVTSGFKASASAVQVARTTTTLTVSPSAALTRQPITLRAVVQPATLLDPVDGTVNFQLGTALLGSVSSNTQFTTVSQTGQITDGTSNTIQFGESTPPSGTGFGVTVVLGDGSVRLVNPSGVFQLVTRDIPAGPVSLSASGGSGSVTGMYTPFTSLYASSSGNSTVSVQKRTVSLTVRTTVPRTPPKVGDPIEVNAGVTPTQTPAADVTPSGNIHVGIGPSTTVDVPLAPISFSAAARGLLTVTLPAGIRTFSAKYDGDSVFLPGSVTADGSITVAKGNVGFALIPNKSTYTVGEPITLLARMQHPKVIGATPTGQITKTSGPSQFQGAAVSPDPNNTGLIDTKLPISGFPPAGNFALTMSYAGDANFEPASAGTILTITKAVPLITIIPPTQVIAGQQATFVVRAGPPAGAGPAVSGQVALTGLANGSSASLVPNTASSVGTIRQTFPAAGTFTVSVQYGGDTNYLAATSAAVQVVVQ